MSRRFILLLGWGFFIKIDCELKSIFGLYKMSSESIPLVPFGKYKGKPITDLIADTSYVDWCKKQDWFKNFPSVYNIVVHQTFQTNTNSKTPEHNKIQNMFLKDDFQNAVLSHLHDLSHDGITNLLNKIYSNKGYIKYFGNQTIDVAYGFGKSIVVEYFA